MRASRGSRRDRPVRRTRRNGKSDFVTLALGLLIGSVGVLIADFSPDAKNSLPLFLALMFLGPCASGASGSIMRTVWTEEASPAQTLRTVVLGVGAGAISAAQYFVTQYVANPNLLKITPDDPSCRPH